MVKPFIGINIEFLYHCYLSILKYYNNEFILVFVANSIVLLEYVIVDLIV